MFVPAPTIFRFVLLHRLHFSLKFLWDHLRGHCVLKKKKKILISTGQAFNFSSQIES